VVHDFKRFRKGILRLACAVGAVCSVLFVAACTGDGRASTVASAHLGSPRAGIGSGLAQQAAARTAQGASSVVVSQSTAQSGGASAKLIAHPENIQLGLYVTDTQLTLKNPRERDPRALEEGKQLFISYNCIDCHGSEGSGAMGPALDDGRWHFGGSAGEVYESISEGRPDGMPAWGGRISDSQIWALVRYVRTLSAGKDPTTENFEGATIQRTGH
jgi:mono/diheme cytochrome c family protein